MTINDFLRESGFKFNKKFGQNFITDTNLLDAIVADAGVTENDTVIEIGTGAGTLTRAIAQKAKKVISFEIDQNLRPVLDFSLKGLNNVEVVFADVLSCGIKKVESLAEGSYKVVANLPYYITTPILMEFLENSENLTSMTVMIQKEVAFRLAASPATKDYGRITLAVEFFGNASLTRTVSRKMFVPQPNVDSAIVRIDKNPRFDTDRKLFSKVVKAAFSMRRKVLTTCLASGLNVSKEKAAEFISALGKPLTVRGEELSVHDFVRLTELYKNDAF